MILPVAVLDGKVVDAGNASAHEAMIVELPVLVAVGAKPEACIVVPLIGKAHSNPMSFKRPQFFDEAIIEFLVPFADQKLKNGRTA